MNIHIDFRLVDVTMELHVLEEHIQLIEIQLAELEKAQQEVLLKKKKFATDDFDWDEANSEYYRTMEFILPRFFWGAFIVSLYAVYETAVTEIARLIQKKMAATISMDDLRGDFLGRAKKYFKNILNFELCNKDIAWQRITMLAELRNAMAHANGRMDMLRLGTQERIMKWTEMNIGILSWGNYFLVNAAFSKETFALVRSSLEDLVERYKEWDSEKRKP